MTDKSSESKRHFVSLFVVLSCTIGLGILLQGCQSAPAVVISTASPPKPLTPYSSGAKEAKLRQLVGQKASQIHRLDDNQKDFALHMMKFAKTAVDAKDYQAAQEALLKIIRFYDSISKRMESAGQASLVEKEIRRFFRGEFYERSFVYFYYGLIHLVSGDYVEARRSFYTSILSDRAYAEEFSHDNALHYWFMGLAYRALDDYPNATGAFSNCLKYLRIQQPDLKEADVRAIGLPNTVITPESLRQSMTWNCALLIEMGYSPNKTAKGSQRQQWKLYQLPEEAKYVEVHVNGKRLERPVVLANVYYQATTAGRSGSKQSLQGTKAFLKTSSVLVPYAGVLVFTFWEVEADRRTWTNLPGRFLLTTFRTQETNPEILLSFYDSGRNLLHRLSQRVETSIDPSRLNVIHTKFFSTRD